MCRCGCCANFLIIALVFTLNIEYTPLSPVNHLFLFLDFHVIDLEMALEIRKLIMAKMIYVWDDNKVTAARTKMEVGNSRTKVAQG